MALKELMRQADIHKSGLCRELQIPESVLDQWLYGSASPPEHIVRAVRLIASLTSIGRDIVMRAECDPVSITRGAGAPTLVSLFSGTGGLDIGLENAGFKTILANEIEIHACESLRANKLLASLDAREFDNWFNITVAGQRCYRNATQVELELIRSRLFPSLTVNDWPLANAEIVERDVRKLTSRFVLEATGTKLGEIDLVAGGAPCQPFSRAGKQETVDCDDGKLFLEFVRLVDELRPRWFLFENVKGLVQHKTEALYSICRFCATESPVSFSLRSAAGTLDHAIDTCASCRKTGAVTPKWEKRRGGSLDMIEAEFSRLGYSCSSNVLNARDFGVPQDRERLFIVGSRDGEGFSWPTPTHGPRNAARSLFDQVPKLAYRSVRDALYQNGHWRYGNLGDEAVLWVKNVVRPHDEPVTWSLDRFAPTVGAHQAAKLAIAPFGVPPAQLARQQWHTLGRRQGDSPPVFVEHEYLTDHELLILQTFPDHWYLHGTRMERAFQIGNAVPPMLAEAVGSSIIAAMNDATRVTPRLVAAL